MQHYTLSTLRIYHQDNIVGLLSLHVDDMIYAETDEFQAIIKRASKGIGTRTAKGQIFLIPWN